MQREKYLNNIFFKGNEEVFCRVVISVASIVQYQKEGKYWKQQ